MPQWVKDEKKWSKAKAIVAEEYPSVDDYSEDFWRLTTGIYKQMGGRIKNPSYSDMTDEELYAIPTEKLDRAAFGFASGDILEIPIRDLEVQYDDDIEQAIYAVSRNPRGWINALSIPIEVKLKNGKYLIEDGHHRFVTAKNLGKAKILAEVTIDDNPITAIRQTNPDYYKAGYEEVQSDLFRGSGYNASTDFEEKIPRFSREMEYYGWGNFPPIEGTILTITERDVEDYEELAEYGAEFELDYSRPLTRDDIGLEYVIVDDGHNRSHAARNTGTPIRVQLWEERKRNGRMRSQLRDSGWGNLRGRVVNSSASELQRKVDRAMTLYAPIIRAETEKALSPYPKYVPYIEAVIAGVTETVRAHTEKEYGVEEVGPTISQLEEKISDTKQELQQEIDQLPVGTIITWTEGQSFSKKTKYAIKTNRKGWIEVISPTIDPKGIVSGTTKGEPESINVETASIFYPSDAIPGNVIKSPLTLQAITDSYIYLDEGANFYMPYPALEILKPSADYPILVRVLDYGNFEIVGTSADDGGINAIAQLSISKNTDGTPSSIIRWETIDSLAKKGLIRFAGSRFSDIPSMRKTPEPTDMSNVYKKFPVNSYLYRFFQEKEIPEMDFEVKDFLGVTNFIPNAVVVEHIAITTGEERKKIENILRQIDYANGDVNHFLKHLAGGIVNKGQQEEYSIQEAKQGELEEASGFVYFINAIFKLASVELEAEIAKAQNLVGFAGSTVWMYEKAKASPLVTWKVSGKSGIQEAARQFRIHKAQMLGLGYNTDTIYEWSQSIPDEDVKIKAALLNHYGMDALPAFENGSAKQQLFAETARMGFIRAYNIYVLKLMGGLDNQHSDTIKTILKSYDIYTYIGTSRKVRGDYRDEWVSNKDGLLHTIDPRDFSLDWDAIKAIAKKDKDKRSLAEEKIAARDFENMPVPTLYKALDRGLEIAFRSFAAISDWHYNFMLNLRSKYGPYTASMSDRQKAQIEKAQIDFARVWNNDLTHSQQKEFWALYTEEKPPTEKALEIVASERQVVEEQAAREAEAQEQKLAEAAERRKVEFEQKMAQNPPFLNEPFSLSDQIDQTVYLAELFLQHFDPQEYIKKYAADKRSVKIRGRGEKKQRATSLRNVYYEEILFAPHLIRFMRTIQADSAKIDIGLNDKLKTPVERAKYVANLANALVLCTYLERHDSWITASRTFLPLRDKLTPPALNTRRFIDRVIRIRGKRTDSMSMAYREAFLKQIDEPLPRHIITRDKKTDLLRHLWFYGAAQVGEVQIILNHTPRDMFNLGEKESLNSDTKVYVALYNTTTDKNIFKDQNTLGNIIETNSVRGVANQVATGRGSYYTRSRTEERILDIDEEMLMKYVTAYCNRHTLTDTLSIIKSWEERVDAPDVPEAKRREYYDETMGVVKQALAQVLSDFLA